MSFHFYIQLNTWPFVQFNYNECPEAYFYLGGAEVFLVTELLINRADFSICCCANDLSLKIRMVASGLLFDLLCDE